MLGYFWVIVIAVSVFCASLTGNYGEMTAALSKGAENAVTLSLSLAGMICLWSGVLELMKRSGLADMLSKALSPVIRRLFPNADRPTNAALASNISANLLGLGNAATPMGLIAAKGLQRKEKIATDAFIRLVVINTASLQLIPVTISSLRATQGAVNPFDILPHIWLSSLVSVTAAVALSFLLARLYKA